MAEWKTRIPFDVTQTDVKFDIKCVNLSQFYSAVLKELDIKRRAKIEMGVMNRPHSKSRSRTVSTLDVAAGHEYGNSFVTPRPFLSTSANEFVNGSFEQETKQNYTYLGAFIKRLAKKLYATIMDCFVTGGFGKWMPLSEEYKRRTGRTEPPLIDTGRLMGAIYVKYEGYTITGKSVGGMFATKQVIWDESDKSQGLSKKRIINLETIKEKRVKEKHKAKVVEAQQNIQKYVPEEKQYDPVILVNKETKKREKLEYQKALERIRKARGK